MCLDDEEFDRVTYDHGCLESLRSLYERGKKVWIWPFQCFVSVAFYLSDLLVDFGPLEVTSDYRTYFYRTSCKLHPSLRYLKVFV